jgi:hypothetical protein
MVRDIYSRRDRGAANVTLAFVFDQGHLGRSSIEMLSELAISVPVKRKASRNDFSTKTTQSTYEYVTTADDSNSADGRLGWQQHALQQDQKRHAI